MDFLTAYAIYATGAILFVGMFALRVPHEDVKIVFILALAWPLSVLLILGTVAITLIGWDMDLARSKKIIGFRRPTNPAMKGFAVTVLFQEFQFYRAKKA